MFSVFREPRIHHRVRQVAAGGGDSWESPGRTTTSEKVEAGCEDGAFAQARDQGTGEFTLDLALF